MASKYIDLSTVKFFMNIVQELETVLEKERFVDHDLESVNLYVDSVKQFADKELFPYSKKWMKILLIIKTGQFMFTNKLKK